MGQLYILLDEMGLDEMAINLNVSLREPVLQFLSHSLSLSVTLWFPIPLPLYLKVHHSQSPILSLLSTNIHYQILSLFCEKWIVSLYLSHFLCHRNIHRVSQSLSSSLSLSLSLSSITTEVLTLSQSICLSFIVFHSQSLSVINTHTHT